MKNKLSKWTNLQEFDRSHSETKRLAGIDEAGRGPVAGPVVAAAVVLDYSVPFWELDDSKKISEKKRLEIFIQIINQSVDFAIASASSVLIDKLNILNATLCAMRNAFEALSVKPDIVIVDGNRKIPKIVIPQKTIIKGDSKSASIAAASILAKVSRDLIMDKFDKKYPHYLFSKHKGYPTKEHLNLLKQHGPCAIHRKSFRPVSVFFQETLF